MWKRFGAAALVLAFSAGSFAQDLKVGDKAPEFKVSEFVKGEAVKDFEKGKIYVVEFWATWCGPCIQTIPHLTKLQKKHNDVVFIGVSVLEQDTDKVKPFVEKMGEKMEYRVAIDSGEGQDGHMAKKWLDAAGENGIPSAFIVNKEGTISWIGHPGQMDKVLAQVVDGKFDMKKAIADREAAKKAQEAMMDMQKEMMPLFRDKKFAEALKVLEEKVAKEPSLAKPFAGVMFQLALRAGDESKIETFMKNMIESAEDGEQLNALAWPFVDPDKKEDVKVTPAILKLCVSAMEKADKISESKSAAIADTLACCYFANKEFDKAVSTAERALKLAKEEKNEEFEKEFEKRIEMFKKAAAEAGKKAA